MQPTATSVSRHPFVSLPEALGGRNNSLGLIRLVLAAMVIFDHAFPLGGFGVDPVSGITHGQATLGSLAVGGFFAISGYLIAKSGLSGDILQFLWRRTLRIFPGYWVVLLVAAFIVAPIIWVTAGGRLGGVLVGPVGSFHYLAANWTLHIGTFGIQDIFATTTPYGRLVGGSVFNGSLWSLIYEWNCYLIIGVGVAFGVLARARFVVPVLTAFFMIAQVVSLVDPAALGRIAPFLSDTYVVSLTLTFLLGSCIAVYPKLFPYDNRLGVLAGLVMLVTLRYGGFATLGTVAAVYFILYLAARLPAVFRRVGACNDYSYGVYIYGFLVQQVLAYLGVTAWGYAAYVAISLLLALGCAWLSWHVVEKRALMLKDRGPGRGWSFWVEWMRSRRAARKQPVESAPPVRPRATPAATSLSSLAHTETRSLQGDQ